MSESGWLLTRQNATGSPVPATWSETISAMYDTMQALASTNPGPGEIPEEIENKRGYRHLGAPSEAAQSCPVVRYSVEVECMSNPRWLHSKPPMPAGLGRAKVALQLSSPSGSSQKCICRASKGTSRQVWQVKKMRRNNGNKKQIIIVFIASSFYR